MMPLFFEHKHNREADIQSLTLDTECLALDSTLGYPIVFYGCAAFSTAFKVQCSRPGIPPPISIDLLTLL